MNAEEAMTNPYPVHPRVRVYFAESGLEARHGSRSGPVLCSRNARERAALSDGREIELARGGVA